MGKSEFEKMADTAKAVGINIIPKHKAAQLLAITYLCGSEDFVFNARLGQDIKTIQRVYGFDGGRVPDGEVCRLLNFYVRELKSYNRHCDWLEKLEEEYKIRFEINIGVQNDIRLFESIYGKTRQRQPKEGS